MTLNRKVQTQDNRIVFNKNRIIIISLKWRQSGVCRCSVVRSLLDKVLLTAAQQSAVCWSAAASRDAQGRWFDVAAHKEQVFSPEGRGTQLQSVTGDGCLLLTQKTFFNNKSNLEMRLQVDF